jgi:hypothetical protein
MPLKLLKYLAIVLFAMTIIAAVIHYKRESIALNIANSALRDQGLTATELSIDTLATDHVILSWLVLRQDDGTRYELKNISFPLSFPSFRMEMITIGEMVVVAGRVTDEPVQVSRLLQTFLDLPQSLPNTAVTLSRLVMPDLPPLHGVAWQTVGSRENLSFGIDDVVVSIEVQASADSGQPAFVDASVGGSANALHMQLNIGKQDTGFVIAGESTLGLLPWLPVLRSMELLPEDLVALDADLNGPVSISIDDDAERPLRLNAEFAIAGKRTLAYRVSADQDVQLQVGDSAPAKIEFQYPSMQWTAEIPHSRIVVTTHFLADAEGQVNNLACRSGIQCTMHVAFEKLPLHSGSVNAAGASFSSTLNVTVGEISQVRFAQDTNLTIKELTSGSVSAASISASGSNGALIVIDTDGWRADIETLKLLVDGVRDSGGLIASFPLALSAVHVRDAASTMSLAFALPAKAAALSWNGMKFIVPGANGTLKLAKDVVNGTAELSGANGSFSAHIDVSQKLSSGKGSLTVRDAVMQFGQRKLSGWLAKWPYPWDIVDGSWSGSAEIGWLATADDSRKSGSMTLQADALAGFYNDIAFTGLKTRLAAALDANGDISVEPATVSIALFDVGIPIQALAAEFDIDVPGQKLDVGKLSMSTLGGTIIADPFHYSFATPHNYIMLRPDSIQLQFMVDLAEFEDLELDGSISGSIPVTLDDTTITVTGGKLKSDPPGGVIRYRSGTAASVNNNEINLASRALGNFQFDSLTSDVDYTEAGDLKLKMRLSGINPDLDPRQPVILNLGVENNIPQLLRSLRATRAIEDVLKKRKPN